MTYKECLEFLNDSKTILECVFEEGAICEEGEGYSYYLMPDTNYVIFNWDNGDKFVGKMINNKFEGAGVYHFADGSVRVGTWKNNELVGKAILFNPDGTCRKEEWENDTTCIYSSKPISTSALIKELTEQDALAK